MASPENRLDLAEVERFLGYLKSSQERNVTSGETVREYFSMLWSELDDPEAVFKSMRNLDGTLQSLARDVQKEMKVCRKEVLPRMYRNGLYTLPFEVFARILELAYDPEDPWPWPWGGRHQALSVNHYFQEAMLRVPRLWTVVDLASVTPAQLARSRTLPLTVTMDFRRTKPGGHRRSLDALLPHAPRWKSLTIRLSDDDVAIAYAQMDLLRDAVRDVPLPVLETLNVDFGIGNVAIAGLKRGAQNFLSSWNMPSLHHLKTAGSLSRLAPICQANLTNLSLDLKAENSPNDLRAIINFLRPLTKLESLSFEFDMEGWPCNGAEPVELPNLKVLAIETGMLGHAEPDAFLDAINAPGLRELRIKAEVSCREEGLEFVDALFPSDSPRWTELESIRFSLDALTGDSDEPDESPFELLCTRLPRLRHLSLESWNEEGPSKLRLHKYFNLPSTGRRVQLTSLRLIHFRHLETSFIVNLGNVVKAPEFEMLEVHRCPDISRDFVQLIMPEGKTWKYTPEDD